MAEVIVALDVSSGAEALRLADQLPGLRWVKVGSVLFTAEGPPLVRALRQRGLSVFLDLKWHDIPATVARAVATAWDRLDVQLATVHALGGSGMMQEAVRAAEGRLRIVGVTILTAHGAGEVSEVLGRDVTDVRPEVMRLARMAVKAGLAGVVASPREVAGLRAALGPARLLVVPGIRRPRDPAGDQQRTGDPAATAREGASHLVVGRPILQATDPGAAFREISDLAETP